MQSNSISLEISTSSLKGILSQKKISMAQEDKKVRFEESSLVLQKRGKESATAKMWKAYIKEQFETLWAHRKRKSRRKRVGVPHQKPDNRQRPKGGGSKNQTGKKAPGTSSHKKDRATMDSKSRLTPTKDGGTLSKPKRPLNAFFVFAKHCRDEFRIHRLADGREVSEALGHAWRFMSKEERLTFYRQAEQLRYDYYRRKEEWERSVQQPTTELKRPLNAYMLFCRDQWPQVKDDMFQARSCQVVCRLASMWQRLTQAQKMVYMKKARTAVAAPLQKEVALDVQDGTTSNDITAEAQNTNSEKMVTSDNDDVDSPDVVTSETRVIVGLGQTVEVEVSHRNFPETSDGDVNESGNPGSVSQGANCNNTWSDSSDRDGQPTPNMAENASALPEAHPVSRGSRRPLSAASPLSGSSHLAFTSVRRDGDGQPRTLSSFSVVSGEGTTGANVSACSAALPPESSSYPEPSGSTSVEFPVRRQRKLRRHKKKSLDASKKKKKKRSADNDLDLSPISENSSLDAIISNKTRRSFRRCMSAMSDDEFSARLLMEWLNDTCPDSKTARDLKAMKGLSHMYQTRRRHALLGSSSTSNFVNEMDFQFSAAEGSLGNTDSLMSMSSDSDELVSTIPRHTKNEVYRKALADAYDESSDSSGSLSMRLMSSHLPSEPGTSAVKQRASAALGELSTTPSPFSLCTDSDSAESSLFLLGEISKEKTALRGELPGDKSLNHRLNAHQKAGTNLIALSKQAGFSGHAYPSVCHSQQTAVEQTSSDCTFVQDDLRFSCSDLVQKVQSWRRQNAGQGLARNTKYSKANTQSLPQTMKSPGALYSSAARARWHEVSESKTSKNNPSLTDKPFSISWKLDRKVKFSPSHFPSNPVSVADKAGCMSMPGPAGTTFCSKEPGFSGATHPEASICTNEHEHFFNPDMMRLSTRLQSVSLEDQSQHVHESISRSRGSKPPLGNCSLGLEEKVERPLESISCSRIKARFVCHDFLSASPSRHLHDPRIDAASPATHVCCDNYADEISRFEDDGRDISCMIMDDPTSSEAELYHPKVRSFQNQHLVSSENRLLLQKPRFHERVQCEAFLTSLDPFMCKNTNNTCFCTIASDIDDRCREVIKKSMLMSGETSLVKVEEHRKNASDLFGASKAKFLNSVWGCQCQHVTCHCLDLQTV